VLLSIHPDNPQPRQISRVADCLRKGGVIIYPTDTIYGLGCDIFQYDAIVKICRIKGIDPKKANFSVICRDLSHLSDFTKSIDTPVFRLLKRSLPGPFTFILPAGKRVPDILQSKKSTIGIRIPDNNICMHILEELGHPIISTSLPGEMVEEYTDPEIIHEKFEDLVDMVVDGGPGGIIPSTVIDFSNSEPEIIRQGLGILDV
jgi:tRNA threonylcarbamoyl adenosine modification protein (Sua5/YciO/YrdC/YwlC family)